MADPSNRESPRARRARRRRSSLGPGVAVLAVAAAIAGVVWWTTRPPPPGDAAPSEVPLEVTDAPPSAPDAATTAEDTEAPATEPIELPPLEASDAFLRERVGALSGHPALSQWLAQSDLASRFTAAVDNLADGRIPRAHLDFLRPSEPFRALGVEPDLRVDPASYARWDPVADAVASIDTGAAVALYERIAPLLQEAFRALGYPDRDFEARALSAVDALLAAPVLEPSPALRAHVNRYLWADPEIEALSPAQKLLLRMGPRNVERIQSQLRAVRSALAPGETTEIWSEGDARE